MGDWKSYQQTVEKAAVSTINLRLTALSSFFKWAVKQGQAKSNPVEEISGLRRQARRPKSLNDKMVRRLLRTVHQNGSKRDIALVELMVGTGLRVSEVLALCLRDVTIGDRSGEVLVRRGKGGVQRRVPLVANVRKALKKYLEEQPDLQPENYLWVGERGSLHDRGAVLYILKKYALQAGLDPDLISPHVMRHTFATRYLNANRDDLRGLAAILGHSDLKTVMIYTEPSTAELTARMEKVED